MASKAQTKYMTTCALVVGVSSMMKDYYQSKAGCEYIKDIIASMLEMGNKALALAHGGVSAKELAKIGGNVEALEKAGLKETRSFQTHLSILIGLIVDRITELPSTSNKVQPLQDILSSLPRKTPSLR